jgi:twinkle protein
VGQFLHHESCPTCGSSDALARYEDGTGWCWSCSTYFSADGLPSDRPRDDGGSTSALLPGEPASLPRRSIDAETCRKYRYLVDDEQALQLATYCDAAGRPVAQKVRTADKKFRWVGEPKKAVLFGQQLWAGGGRRVVVTEGEIDALSVAQVFERRWPVVSVPNGASAAKADLTKHLEWLESFEQVVLLFDTDEPGQKAAADCAELFSPGKCRIGTLPLKDANEMLVAGRTRELVSAVFEAKPYRPDGIVNGADLWEAVSRELPHGTTYPWPSLDRVTYGMRSQELVTWCAGTGIGKSQFVREVAHHLAMHHRQKVGIIALEESNRQSALAQMSLFANARLHLPPVRAEFSTAQLRAIFEQCLGTGRYELYDHFGSVEAATLLPKIRHMVLAGKCRWIVLDHVSIMVSGYAAEGDERKRLDELMTRLRSLVQELDFGLHLVSHLRRSGGETPHEEGGKISLADLRGSGAIGHVSDIVIGVERNQQAVGDARNRSHLRILKNRFSGDTGSGGTLTYDHKTGRLFETALAVPASSVSDDAKPKGDF